MNTNYNVEYLRFRVVQLHVSHFKHILTTGDQAAFGRNISSWSDSPTLYHGHFAYFDPNRFSTLPEAISTLYHNLYCLQARVGPDSDIYQPDQETSGPSGVSLLLSKVGI